MNIIERAVGFIAPHNCLVCGDEGSVVCEWCLPDFATPLPSRCYCCKAQTKDGLICSKCRRKSSLRHVWVRTAYDERPKRLIHDFKFERKKAAAEVIARLMVENLPYLNRETVVTHIPTATSRVRRRGYDPAELIARALAKESGLKHKTMLLRVTQTRQVGAKRNKRIMQMEYAFKPALEVPSSVPVLLVDDLTTTGATLESAAKCLKTAGAKTVNAAVFAQK